MFPANKAYWVPQSRRILSTRPGSDGHFKFPNLPAGDYLIAAVTDVEQGEWYDPAFLAQLGRRIDEDHARRRREEGAEPADQGRATEASSAG